MSKKVIGIGEVLWDIFPKDRRLGGASCNFAYHCGQVGLQSVIVSRVGCDSLGTEMIQALNQSKTDTNYLQKDAVHPTGTVLVRLDSKGVPTFEITENVAWDYVEMTKELESLARSADAICFGSLAQRKARTKKTIYELIRLMPEKSLKIFDVNLRQHFYSREVLDHSLVLANVLKVSEEELPILANAFNLTGSVVSQLTHLLSRFKLKLIAYTRGGNGSLLLTADHSHDHLGCKAVVVDTVGAGDSFTAVICWGLLHRLSLAEINALANQTAAYVCSQAGAMPVLPQELVNQFNLLSQL
ncbi:MAG: carbohydrate kinase [Verrucomicrobiota bacterium]